MLLTVQNPQSSWKFFDLCKVHPWNSLSCQAAAWCVPDSASQQLHWPRVKMSSSSFGCTAVFLMPFQFILLVTWCQDLLLAVSSCVAYKDVQLYLQCPLLFSSPSLLLIFCWFSSLISLWLTLPLSEFKPSVLCQSFSHTSLCQRWFYCWGKFILHFPSRWYKLFVHAGQQFCLWGYLLA